MVRPRAATSTAHASKAAELVGGRGVVPGEDLEHDRGSEDRVPLTPTIANLLAPHRISAYRLQT